MRFGILLGVACVACVTRAGTVEVSPQGLSPQGALEKIRAARAKGDTSAWTVKVAPGEYRLTAPLVFGPGDSNIDFIGAKGVTFTGGGKLGPWKNEGRGVWSAALPKGADGRPLWFEQLFVNGRRAVRARLPNAGCYKFLTMTNFCGAASRWIERCSLTNADACAALTAATSAQLSAAALCVDAKWCYAKRVLRAWDPATKTVETHCRGPVPQFARWERTTNIFFENLPAGFDAPGEWLYDAAGGKVRYRPLPGEDMKTAVVTVPVSKISRLVEITGDPDTGKLVRNVSFNRIVFAFSDVSESLASTTRGPAEIVQYQAAFCHDGTVEVEGADGVQFVECAFRHTGNHGLKFKNGCRNSLVRRCLFDDVGAGGVWIGADDGYVTGDEKPLRRRDVRKLAPRATAFITVEDCEIRNGGQFNPEGTGVVITHASDCRVEHCDIHDFFYSGVSVGWTWGYGGSVAQRNTIAFNRIHDLGKGRMSDMGGVYTLGTSYGTCVSNNVIWNVRSYDYGGWGLYTDEGSEGIVLENNLVYDTHDGGFHQHYGADNLVRNNIFAFNRMEGAIRTYRWTGEDEVRNTLHVYGNVVYTDGSPLVGDGVRHSWGVFADNVWFDAAKDAKPLFDGLDWEGWRNCGKEIGGVYADPLFENAAKRDFRLKPDSPALKLGFRPWDYAQAGIRRQPRPNPQAKKPWVVVNEDVNTTIAVAIPEGKLTRAGLREHIDRHIRAKNITHYFVNPQAMLAGYDTKVSEPMWTEHPGLVPAPKWVRKLKKLHDDGIDPYAVWIGYVRECGIVPWLSMRMNDVHCVEEPRNGFATKMWLEHREWRRNPGAEKCWRLSDGAFDYSHPEVRAFFLAWAREMLERYDVDGFECDWMRFAHHLPIGKEQAHAFVLTGFMRDIRKLANEIGAKRGKKIQVGARVATSPESALSLGTDAVTWAKEGLIDVLTVANFFECVDFEAPWAEWKKLIKTANPDVRLLAGVDNGIERRRGERSIMTKDEHAGYFDNAFSGGIEDGWALFNYFMQEVGDPVYDMLVRNDFGPDVLAGLRRTYAVTFRDETGDAVSDNAQLPVVLDKPADIRITVGTPRPGDAVTVRLFRSKDEVRTFAGLSLNGRKTTGPVEGTPDTYAFSSDSVRPGVNVLTVGAVKGLKLRGVELTLTPKGK